MKHFSQITIAFLSALLVSGCTGYRPAPPAFHEALYQPYVLDSGDRLRVTVFDQDNLTNTYSVDQAGYIQFPLVGSVPARGQTSKQVERKLAQMLQKGYLRDPDVTVEIDRYRPVFVMGEVGAPGQYYYVPGMTIQKAVAAAGGFTPRANQQTVDVTRNVNGRVMTGRLVITEPLVPGDAIYVRERLF
ncbi:MULTISPECIES: polysaccharide biosynthesis/export family protein [Phyllobacteriaceae]|uniref:polysaccharide biosynthesis/export family protein n=1 Tax=Phyllobacteriaceae TaxID=69277 RepID=UPI002ACA8EBB|nr:polysaccharide biosynthesis/export family protein [Chelativorans sp. M5D2P16]MDZ5696906.1 polysaccharide biosynthesis/export family protein [Chelativorans sp. M5D2P16]